VTGGIFIISRELYRSVGGMREYFVKTQDYDFGLRLAKKGIFLLRKSQVIVKHYTISYHSTVRIFYFIRTLYFIYSGLLIRKHITNKYFFKILIRKFNSPILLLLSIIFMSYSVYAILVYFLITFLRILKQNEKNNKILLLVFFIIRDITIILGFLFYYPTTKNNYFS